MKGWYGDRQRHQLASRGIKTGIKSDMELESFDETLKDFKFYRKNINGIDMICFDIDTEELSNMYSEVYMQMDMMELFEKFVNKPKNEEYEYIFRNIKIIPITRKVTFYPDEYHEVRDDVTVGFTVCANEMNENGTSGVYSLATVLYAFSSYVEQESENLEVDLQDMKSAKTYMRNNVSTYDLKHYIDWVDYNILGKEVW